MKILISTVTVNEDIHGLESGLSDVISKTSPDYIFLVTGEGMAIHSHMISELHMFEYSNVRFAVWNLIEDILYRLDNLPEYHIAVYPTSGVYRCKETGYLGTFRGIENPIGYIQYEYVRKILDKELDEKVEYILYAENEVDAILLWETFKPIFNIEKAMTGEPKISFIDRERDSLKHIVTNELLIGWREVKPIHNFNLDEIGLIRFLAYAIDNKFITIFKDPQIRREFIDRMDDILGKLEYIFYSSTVSDREGYELNVIHEKDVGIIMSKCALIKYLLHKLGLIDRETIVNSYNECGKEDILEVFNKMNRLLLGNGEDGFNFNDILDFIEKLARCLP